MEWPSHGGQPHRIAKQLGIPAEQGLLDFSANLNPLGAPEWLTKAWRESVDALRRYPDPDYPEAHAALADANGVEPEQVLLANGGAEAIFLAAQLFAGGTVAVAHPAFSEYERACGAFGIRVKRVYADAFDQYRIAPNEALLRECDALFVCRPCNPTGTVWEESEAEAWLEQAQSYGTTIVVDEAFYDFLPVPYRPLTKLLARYPNLLLLRSYTKMYAVPGLRLGYALGSAGTIKRMWELQIPWSVNGVAAELATRLAHDESFATESAAYVAKERDRVFAELQALGYAHSASKANFYVLRDPLSQDSDGLMRFLFVGGIVARHTSTFRGLEGAALRFAVRSAEENDRLLARLREWRERR